MNETFKTLLLALTFAFMSPVACSGEKPTETTGAAEAATKPVEEVADTTGAPEAGEAPRQAVNEPPGQDEPEPADSGSDEPVKLAQADSTADEPAPKKAPAGPAPYRPGDHYSILSPAQPTGAPPGKIEVVEAFMYTCPHCYNFEPYIDKWLPNKPDFVEFVRIPALFNKAARIHARVYYTAETLDIVDEIHMPFFRELHVNRKAMTDQDELAAFFEGFGIDKETFNKTFNSFAVDTKLRRAESMNRRYRISSTPMLVVNGKYLTDGDKITGYNQLLEIAEYLATKESGRL